jgi:signal transduction histidine kinase
LVAQNEAARERERKHIAREVHDELGQILTALRMDTSFIAMRFGTLDPALNAKVLGMRALVDNAIQGVRNVASNLRPVALDMGLFLALDWLCKDFVTRTGIACVLDTKEQQVVLDEARSVVVFRIVQESLTNISRYAHASRVLVTVGLRANELGVEVQDDGAGFDPALPEKAKTFGLLGMKERALALGGRLDVVSAPGQGTTIGLTIPYERPLDGGAA